MSLTVDGVWKAGVWATTVWADGVWFEGSASTLSTGGGWPPVLIGNKKGKRKAKRLIDEIREAVQALYAKDEDVGIIQADAIITEIREIIPTVDRYPELLQQLIHLEQRAQAYLREVEDDDDDFYFLM